jgi:Amt family ammonium transporter
MNKCHPNSPTIPVLAFATFQMMFAAITPLLMTGSFAERVRWKPFFIFTIFWEILVFYPVAHWMVFEFIFTQQLVGRWMAL